MKPFHSFLIVTEVVFFICFLFLAFGFVSELPEDSPNQLGIFTTENTALSDSSTKQVTIYDQGLQMVYGTYAIPTNWSIQQDVYTSPYTYDYYTYGYNRSGSRNRFLVSFNGSQGEIIRCQDHYDNYQWGKATDFKKFKSEVDSLCRVGLLSYIDDLEVGEFSANNPTGAKYLTNYVKIDSMYQYLKAPFTGKMEGKNYKGIVRLFYPILASSVDMARVIVILAPVGALSEVLKTENQIAFSYHANPAYEQYHLNTRRWHQQYLDQIDDYNPENLDSIYNWEEYQDWVKITPNYNY